MTKTQTQKKREKKQKLDCCSKKKGHNKENKLKSKDMAKMCSIDWASSSHVSN